MDCQYGCHFGNADGLEHILVHTGLDGSLGIFKFSIAADDNVKIRLEFFAFLGHAQYLTCHFCMLMSVISRSIACATKTFSSFAADDCINI